MAAKPIPPHIEVLIKQYQQSQINLINMIAAQEAKGNVTAYRKLILNDVNQELKVLNEYAEGWAQKYIPKAYTEGTAQTYEAYRAAQLSVPAVAVNQTVVNTLVQNALGMLTDATQFVGRRINDEVRKAGIEAIASKVSTGSTALQAKKNLIQSLTDKGITAIRDKTGREIKLDVYAELVARTTTREATNKGMISVVEGIGRDLVKMSHHATACPICAPLEGRIYSVSGKDKRYPALQVAFPNGYATVHPNCRHVLMPYIEEFDDNFDDNLASSNRPFKLDEEQTKKLDSYYKNQKIKSDRRTDRNEWERAKLIAPDLTPKTFSGYRAGKKANSPTYQTLKERMKLEAPKIKVAKPTLQIAKGRWGNGISEELGDKLDIRLAELRRDFPLLEGTDIIHGTRLTIKQDIWDRGFKRDLDYEISVHPRTSVDRLEGKLLSKYTPRPRDEDFINGEHWLISKDPYSKWNRENTSSCIGITKWPQSTKAEALVNRDKWLNSGKNIFTTSMECPEFTLAHEYGHELSFEYSLRTGSGPAGKVKKYYESLTKEEIERGLSVYATTDFEEFIAEAFSEGLMPNPREIGVKFHSILKEVNPNIKATAEKLDDLMSTVKTKEAILEKEIVWGGHIPGKAIRQDTELAKYWGVSVQEAQDTRVTIGKYTEFVSDAKKIRAASILDDVQLKNATVQQLKSKAAADSLEKIIETGPSFKGQLNRGMIVKTDELKAYTKVGSIIDTRGMTSWTSNAETAESFARIETAKFNAFGKQVGELSTANKNSVVLIGQDFKYSTSIDELGPFKMDEVLVSKNVNLEVTKVTAGTGRSKGTTYIYVKEVLK